MDVSVVRWWYVGCMYGCVGRWGDVWIYGLLDERCFGEYVDGCVGRWVVVGWMYEWMCR